MNNQKKNKNKNNNENYCNDVQTCNKSIFYYIKRLLCFLKNVCITCKILLTTLIRIVSAKRSFSKLKLIKFYLRLIMSQEN